jgi:hypothetical protein
LGYQLLNIKNKLVTKILKKPLAWMDSLVKQTKRKKMDMRSGAWNIKSMYRAGSLRAVSKSKVVPVLN